MTLVYPQELEEGGAKKRHNRKTRTHLPSNEGKTLTEDIM